VPGVTRRSNLSRLVVSPGRLLKGVVLWGSARGIARAGLRRALPSDRRFSWLIRGFLAFVFLVESSLPLLFLFLQAGQLFASLFTLIWRSSHVVLLSVRRAEPQRQGTGGTFFVKGGPSAL